ncbi:hypothetical protein [Agromyces albus]|uniref:hypothetical protein n=1 Tax=Agromyces albus TaxID=205332 RepID=UPI0013E98447|nr:hypothetical protein [Agromyces albus]
MQIGRGARVARGLSVAVSAILLASLAHTIGGGNPPGAATIALSLAFSGPFAIVMIGSRQSTVRAGLAAAAAQFTLHALYSLTAGENIVGAAGAPLRPHADADHLRSSLVLGVDASAAAHDEHFGSAMLVAHVCAAALTVAAIALTDRVLNGIQVVARGIRLAWILVAAPLVPPTGMHLSPAVGLVVAPHGVAFLQSSLSRRGPPQSRFAAFAATP